MHWPRRKLVLSAVAGHAVRVTCVAYHADTRRSTVLSTEFRGVLRALVVRHACALTELRAQQTHDVSVESRTERKILTQVKSVACDLI